MWDSYQVIRTTFHFSSCPELSAVILFHLCLLQPDISASFLDDACPLFLFSSYTAGFCKLQHLFCVQENRNKSTKPNPRNNKNKTTTTKTKITRKDEFGEVPGEISPFSILCAMGAVVPLCSHPHWWDSYSWKGCPGVVSHGQEWSFWKICW